MWVKRTDAEIAEERERRRRTRLRGAVLFGFFVLFIITCFFGWREAADRSRFTSPVVELLSRLPFALVAAIICAFLSYKLDRKRPMMICPKCEATKYEDGVTACSCGGRFEKMEMMKYVA